jgi:transcriptional antiterminator NusG
MAEDLQRTEEPEPLPESPEDAAVAAPPAPDVEANDAETGEAPEAAVPEAVEVAEAPEPKADAPEADAPVTPAPVEAPPAPPAADVETDDVEAGEAPAANVAEAEAPEADAPVTPAPVEAPSAPPAADVETDDVEAGEAPAADVAEAQAPEADAPVAPAPVDASGKQWYIIHTYSGFEHKVAESLRSRAQAFGFAEKIGNVLIPTEEVVEMRAGRKVISKRLLYPGYVLVEMAMDDQLWHEVKNTPRVTGFVGGGNNPVPLTADEVNSILFRQASSAERPRPKQTFEKNETVRIVDGPFASFSGKVDEINSERDTLRVMVTIFGRSTPVELEFTQVEKI